MKKWVYLTVLFVGLCLPAGLILWDYNQHLQDRLSGQPDYLPLVSDDESAVADEDRLLYQVMDRARGQAAEVGQLANQWELPGIEQQFGGLFQLLNGSDLSFYDSLSGKGDMNWDVYQNIIEQDAVRFVNLDTIQASMKVFGWHPYWMGSAYESYHFNLLSHVSWFAYNVDPETGGYTNPEVIQAWRNTPFIDAAKEGGSKVLLTIANHTPGGNRIFLRNRNRQQENLIDSLVLLLEERGGDGIDVNFELVPEGLQLEMTNFLIKLSERLHAEDKIMTLVLPKVNLPISRRRSKARAPYLYDIERLATKVDYFLITGYDFHTGNSYTDGPIAPLRSSGPYSIEKSVYQYLDQGLPRDRLILGLPYYGGVWSGTSNQLRDRGEEFYFEKHLTYRAIMAKYGRTQQRRYEPESWSAYYIVQKDSTNYEKVWFDDTVTLAKKYEWVEGQNLAGIGIWALGYDNGTLDLWQLLARQTGGGQAMAVRFTDAKVNGWFFNLASNLFSYRNIVILLGLFLAGAFILGLAISIFDWRVRDLFFENKTLRIVYVLSAVAILFGLYYFLLYVAKDETLEFLRLFPFAIGLLLGGILTILVYNRFRRHRSKLP